MSGGGGKTQTATQTQATQQTLPAWLDNQSQANLAQANAVADRPYEQYGGQRVAGFSGDQSASQNAVRAMQGQTGTALQGYAAQAGQVGQGAVPQVQAGQLSNTDLSPYMNPYMAAVEQSSLGLMNDQRMLAQSGIEDKSFSQGAFGGSRQAIQQAVMDSQYGRQAGDLSNQIRAAGYNTALQSATSDLTRSQQAQTTNQGAYLQNLGLGLQGTQLAGQLTGQAQQAGYNDIQALSQSGLQQQQLQQANLDSAAQQWQNQWNYPQQALDIKMAALKGVPYAGGSTSTSTNTTPTQGTSPAMGALGGAASGAAMGSVAGPWGMAAGAVIGGVGGYMSSK